MKDSSQLQCLGYPVCTGALDSLPTNQQLVVNTIDQYPYCIAGQNPEFKKSLEGGDILLADGIGIAAKLLEKKKIRKIAGADLHGFLLEKLNCEGGSCFYLGTSAQTLQKIEN